MKTSKCWHWPDHVIGKRESRRLREEHNELASSHDELLQVCVEMAELAGIGPESDLHDLENSPEEERVTEKLRELLNRFGAFDKVEGVA